MLGQAPAGRFAVGRVAEDDGRRLGVAEQAGHHGDLVLPAQVGQDEIEVAPSRELGVAQHVPGRRPAQAPGQRIVERAQALGDGGQRAGVEADLRVGQLAVVEEDEVGDGHAHQLVDGRAVALDVELHPVAAPQPA